MLEFNNSNLTNFTSDEDNRYFQHNFDAILRSILITRAKEGATLAEIKDDYNDLIGEPFPIISNATDYLLSIPFVTCIVDSHGTRIFNLTHGGKSNHILNMVQQQKPDRNYNYIKKNYDNPNNNIKKCNNKFTNFQRNHNSSIYDMKNNKNNENIFNYYYNMKNYQRDFADNCYSSKHFYEDNCNYMKRKFIGSTETLSSIYTNSNNNYKYPNTSSSAYSSTAKPTYNYDISYQSKDEPFVCKVQLLGDDFFLHLSKAELKVHVKKGPNKVYYSGLCVSGQTIADATEHIKRTNKLTKKIILNIGSVDIMQGHFFIDIKNDFQELIKAICLNGCTPILTTLPPLGNLNHRAEIKTNLDNFNNYIRTSGFPFIDIWKTMVDEKSNTLYDCYQSEARYVSGSCHPHLLWNKIGRQRILKYIKNNLL